MIVHSVTQINSYCKLCSYPVYQVLISLCNASFIFVLHISSKIHFPFLRLLVMGLERYLDPKYRSSRCSKKEQHKLLTEALAQVVKDLVITKTLPQALTRVKNLRMRVKDAPTNSILVSPLSCTYLLTYLLDTVAH